MNEFIFSEEGGKQRLYVKRVGLLLSPAFALGAGISVYPRHEDTSYIDHTTKHLVPEPNSNTTGSAPAKGIFHRGNDTNIENVPRKSHPDNRPGDQGTGSGSNSGGGIKYHAIQVIDRKGGDPGKMLPIGTSFIGRLITGIDTREQNSLVRVLAPYGGSFEHERHIEKNAVLFGNVNYSGSGERVYIKFNRMLSPDGKEFKIDAQALSSIDYSPGILGDESDGAGSRVAGTVGLTMLSGMTDALVEKQSLSQFADPTAKANLRDGFYNGIAKATESEAQRRSAKITDVKDYVTVPAGLDVIISLTETFKGESL